MKPAGTATSVIAAGFSPPQLAMVVTCLTRAARADSCASGVVAAATAP